MSKPVKVKPLAWERFGWRVTGMKPYKLGAYLSYESVKMDVDALQARIAELEKDAARIEFLEKKYFGVDGEYMRDFGKSETVLMLSWLPTDRVSSSLRVTVDEAMKAAQ